MMKTISICYKTIQPVIYNKGTQYEKQYSDFLLTIANEHNAQSIIDELNADKSKAVRYGEENIDNIAYFYNDGEIDTSIFKD